MLAAPAAMPASTNTPAMPFPVSDHCDGHRFFNPRGQFESSLLNLLKWKLSAKPTPWPSHVAVPPTLPPQAPTDDGVTATWIGHATFLLRTRLATFLTDPVWSERVGPWGIGPRRIHEPGVRFDDLPPIDAILLSHDHYDHCDVATLARLNRQDGPTIFAPIGHRGLLRQVGFADEKIVELDWWESHAFAGTTITLTPARHWTNRLGSPANSRLWGSFFLKWGGSAAWFAGDTGYDAEYFRAIREKLGSPRLALIPIGAYEPRWFMEPVHCNPVEAVQIHRDLAASQSLGMHWGTFRLTDEGREAPPAALASALTAAGLSHEVFKVLAPGASVTV